MEMHQITQRKGEMAYKVLIVDDSKLARMAVVKALNVLHPEWTRIEASGAADALKSIEEHAPHVALLDFNMPDRDGLALAAELKQLSPQTQVAVISANHQKDVVSRAESLGAAFLPKPLTEVALAQFLRVAVERLSAGSQ